MTVLRDTRLGLWVRSNPRLHTVAHALWCIPLRSVFGAKRVGSATSQGTSSSSTGSGGPNLPSPSPNIDITVNTSTPVTTAASAPVSAPGGLPAGYPTVVSPTPSGGTNTTVGGMTTYSPPPTYTPGAEPIVTPTATTPPGYSSYTYPQNEGT